MPQGFFGHVPTHNEVYFVIFPYIPAIVDRRIPLKRDRKTGKWNWSQRSALTKQLEQERRAGHEKMKSAGLRAARHYTTEEAALAFVAQVKKQLGIELTAAKGCYL